MTFPVDTLLSLTDIARLYDRKHGYENNLSATLDNKRDLTDILDMENKLVNKYHGYRTVTLGVTFPKSFCIDKEKFPLLAFSLTRELSTLGVIAFIWNISTFNRDNNPDNWDVYMLALYPNTAKLIPTDNEDLKALMKKIHDVGRDYQLSLHIEPYIVTHPTITVDSYQDLEARNMARYQIYDVYSPRYQTEGELSLLKSLPGRVGFTGAMAFGMVADMYRQD
jgi:hypothetical protein